MNKWLISWADFRSIKDIFDHIKHIFKQLFGPFTAFLLWLFLLRVDKSEQWGCGFGARRSGLCPALPLDFGVRIGWEKCAGALLLGVSGICFKLCKGAPQLLHASS